MAEAPIGCSFYQQASDADSEAAETQVWLDFAKSCGYLLEESFVELDKIYEEICGGLVNMMVNAGNWCGPAGERTLK